MGLSIQAEKMVIGVTNQYKQTARIYRFLYSICPPLRPFITITMVDILIITVKTHLLREFRKKLSFAFNVMLFFSESLFLTLFNRISLKPKKEFFRHAVISGFLTIKAKLQHFRGLIHRSFSFKATKPLERD